VKSPGQSESALQTTSTALQYFSEVTSQVQSAGGGGAGARKSAGAPASAEAGASAGCGAELGSAAAVPPEQPQRFCASHVNPSPQSLACSHGNTYRGTHCCFTLQSGGGGSRGGQMPSLHTVSFGAGPADVQSSVCAWHTMPVAQSLSLTQSLGTQERYSMVTQFAGGSGIDAGSSHF
jgi:hypothetical protein